MIYKLWLSIKWFGIAVCILCWVAGLFFINPDESCLSSGMACKLGYVVGYAVGSAAFWALVSAAIMGIYKWGLWLARENGK